MDYSYPEFDSDILITVDKPFPLFFIEESLIKKIPHDGMSISAVEIDRPTNYARGEWIPSSSFINLYLSEKFIQNHFLKTSEALASFREYFKILIQPFTSFRSILNSEPESEKRRPFAPFSVFYRTKENFHLQFIFDLDGNEDTYLEALDNVYRTIEVLNQPEENSIQLAIRKSYSQSNGIKYLMYLDKQWNVLNPLLEVGREINERYRSDKDFRIKKPHVIMHRDNYSKYIVLDSNWVLQFDDFEMLMIKPNDVALYSNISSTNLKTARQFYEDVISKDTQHRWSVFPSTKLQSQYYDYFELVITALIFSYTALEAFANICIPNHFEYLVEKDGVKTIYSKQAIERRFSLRDKFKTIIRSILNTPDPSQTNWWNDFINLENLRDEVIHTKQSRSEDRYSQLLTKRIFQTIEIHKEVIHFYGYFITEYKNELLDEFPYNLGYDDFYPGLTDEKGYESFMRRLHNGGRVTK